MQFLEEYAVVHFQTEEGIMIDNEYPFVEQHRKEHATFIKYFLHLKEILQDKSEDRIYLTFRIQLFLGDWIINHTAKTDRHLGNYLRRRGVNI